MRLSSSIAALLLAGCGGIAIIDGDDEPAIDDPRLDQPCGGAEDEACGPNTYCDREDAGGCMAEGVCRPRPAACPDSGQDVCGCDGVLYPSPCEARLNGVESAGDEAFCPRPPETRALARFDASAMIFMHLDVELGICVRIRAARGAAPLFPIAMLAPWEVTAISAYDTTDACLAYDETPPALELEALGASGNIVVKPSGVAGCSLSLGVDVDFPPDAWLWSPFRLEGEDAPIQGVCP